VLIAEHASVEGNCWAASPVTR